MHSKYFRPTQAWKNGFQVQFCASVLDWKKLPQNIFERHTLVPCLFSRREENERNERDSTPSHFSLAVRDPCATIRCWLRVKKVVYLITCLH